MKYRGHIIYSFFFLKLSLISERAYIIHTLYMHLKYVYVGFA